MHPLCDQKTGGDGAKKFAGNKNLKRSQEYTRSFGVAIRKTITKNESKIKAHKASLRKAACKAVRMQVRALVKDPWKDAELASVVEFLMA